MIPFCGNQVQGGDDIRFTDTLHTIQLSKALAEQGRATSGSVVHKQHIVSLRESQLFHHSNILIVRHCVKPDCVIALRLVVERSSGSSIKRRVRLDQHYLSAFVIHTVRPNTVPLVLQQLPEVNAATALIAKIRDVGNRNRGIAEPSIADAALMLEFQLLCEHCWCDSA